ncbi:hypothetical protein BDP55DRAFT_655350 [Colletotrichum godetiae]|uniref:Uncharacterized protein n=1 Tax=Colletotrichum godetiae TaxID=1209918 RepID=A0AAJ0F0U6_9PEZI|nr:uncharacterized protein BDP55DRAFT_655350 [Colletotrichum godetiae]KAK1688827.1 hypothetical protein BDP55DRAFT_655350 [Colletotrichum godetiae]
MIEMVRNLGWRMIAFLILFACSGPVLIFRTAVSFPRHALLENSLPWPAAHVTAKGGGLGTNFSWRDPDPNTEMLRVSPQVATAGSRPVSSPVPLLDFRPVVRPPITFTGETGFPHAPLPATVHSGDARRRPDAL